MGSAMVSSIRKGSLCTPNVFLGLKISNFLSFGVILKNYHYLLLGYKNIFSSSLCASQVRVGTPDG